MYSVIIPTMWVPSTFCDQLQLLCAEPAVSEIIIINNKVAATPTCAVLSDAKIKMLNQEQNIFVNPAWNLGVSSAINDQICILNDDLVFDTKVFALLTEEVLLSCGIVGLNMFDSLGELKYNIIEKDSHAFGYGCMMFIHKSRYIPIPEKIKIMYGDTFLITRLRNKYPLIEVRGLHTNQVISATCRDPEVMNVTSSVEQSDTQHWASIQNCETDYENI